MNRPEFYAEFKDLLERMYLNYGSYHEGDKVMRALLSDIRTDERTSREQGPPDAPVFFHGVNPDCLGHSKES